MLYSEHDRPSVQRMVITVAGFIAGIAAVIGIASVVFGLATSHSGVRTVAPATATVSVQTPATATAPLADALPAASASTTTTWEGAGIASTAPPAVTTAAPKPQAAVPTGDAGLGIVVIDAGHEGSPPSGTEPIGPGSSTMKVKLESGATGVATKVSESQRNLEVALVLEKVLKSRGISVVMVRTSENVKISNKQRAEIANKAHAALFIRLHCDSGPSSVTGILTLEPGKDWVPAHPIVARSAVAAKIIHAATLASTGAKDRGITSRTDLTGFNWAQVPSVLVEMGLMSNRAEDVKLGTSEYQQKLADGMANGIVTFLKRK